MITKRRKVLFLLDFDGTLAPLASAPDNVRLPEVNRSLLAGLRSPPRVTVAILSGRSLSDIQACVDLPSLYYGGNHGMEIQGPGVSFRHRGAISMRSIVQSLARKLQRELRLFPGAVVENKGLTLSVHYRRVPRGRLPAFRRLLGRLRVETSSLPVRWNTGRKVWEVVPDVEWDKGAAARYLIGRLQRPFPVALGDDTTDEDIFTALKGRGLTIRVGRRTSSHADYYLNGQSQVARFLRLVKAALDTVP